jgi:long-chain acyl-CoA synthetase
LCQLFDEARRTHAARSFLGTKVSGRWDWMTYGAFGNLVDRLRGGLASLGLRQGDSVAMISANRPEWAVAAFASYTLGATLVPMYEAQHASEWDFVLRESKAPVVFVANQAVLRRGAALFASIPTLRTVVLLDDSSPDRAASNAVPLPGTTRSASTADTTYATLLAAPPASRVEPAPDDTAALIYTSGTTGTPKGVVLAHENIASNVSAIRRIFEYRPSDRSLAFLPWAHVYGQTAELYMLMSCGSSIALCEGPEKIIENLAEVRPTVFITVPRVLRRMQAAAEERLANTPETVRRLVSAAVGVAARERAGGRVGVSERILARIAQTVLGGGLRAVFGGRLRRVSSGSAALPVDVAAFFDAIGIPVYEGYGLTEASPVVSTSVPGARRAGTVGRPLPGVRVVIERHPRTSEGELLAGGGPPNEGEIVVYGPNVMKGYWQRPQETAEALGPDGGLRTGDLGFLDADGYLSITGRLKEQYKLDNGKFVAPSRLEEELRRSAYVANVMVYGENRPFNVALIVPHAAALAAWATAERLTLPRSVGELIADARVVDLFTREVARLGRSFRGYEAIVRFALIAEDFTVERGLLTPKLSLKRRAVVDAYARVIEGLYGATSETPSRVLSSAS